MSEIAGILVDGSNVDKADLRAYMGAREVANVKSPAYGAVGDGATNDTTVINSFITGLGVGDLGVVPPSNYAIGGTISQTRDDVKLLMDGATFTHTGSAEPAFKVDGGDGVTTSANGFNVEGAQ